jgi:hypothetical protein
MHGCVGQPILRGEAIRIQMVLEEQLGVRQIKRQGLVLSLPRSATRCLCGR